LCPPMILNNRTLVWTEVGSAVLRVSDKNDPTGAWWKSRSAMTGSRLVAGRSARGWKGIVSC
jgi:hypothetical protein